MQSPPVIRNLDVVIDPYLNGFKFDSYESRFLTKPGDNYGSTMLAVTAKIKNAQGECKEVELVAKLQPLIEFLATAFQTAITFGKENRCYTDIAPALVQLQREARVPEEEIIDVFPKCYGARISLNSQATVADQDALLLLENLIVQGYKVGDRIKGFDYDHTKIILENLAKFHAVPIALRMLKPEVFEKYFRPILRRFNIEDGMNASDIETFEVTTINDIEKHTNLAPEKFKRCKDLIERSTNFMRNKKECEDGLFTTVAHYDFWVNNMLIHYDSNGKPDKIKIVDFQITQYESCVHDLIFFLFSSVDSLVLKENFDSFITFYYGKFIECLKKTGADISQYTNEKFQAEVKAIGQVQFFHICSMLKVLFARRGTAVEMKDMENGDPYDEQYPIKLRDVLSLFDKLGWL